MSQMIETLESRTMFSATIGHTPMTGALHAPAVHAAKITAPVVTYTFKGTAFNTTQNKLAANLVMTVTKNDKGYQGNVVATDPGTGAVTKFTVQFDASGKFVYNLSETGGKMLHLEGQLNADKNTITGTWTETRKDGSSKGTFSLSRSDGTVTPPAPTPPAPTAGSHYIGSATDNHGKTTGLVMDLVTAADGSVFGIVKHTNSDGSVDTITVKFDANGHFVFNGDIGGKLHVEGQLSADKKTCTGTFTSAHQDRPADTGTFTMTRT